MTVAMARTSLELRESGEKKRRSSFEPLFLDHKEEKHIKETKEEEERPEGSKKKGQMKGPR